MLPSGACGARVGRCGFGWPRNRPEESVREPVCFGRVRGTVAKRCCAQRRLQDGLVSIKTASSIRDTRRPQAAAAS